MTVEKQPAQFDGLTSWHGLPRVLGFCVGRAYAWLGLFRGQGFRTRSILHVLGLSPQCVARACARHGLLRGAGFPTTAKQLVWSGRHTLVLHALNYIPGCCSVLLTMWRSVTSGSSPTFPFCLCVSPPCLHGSFLMYFSRIAPLRAVGFQDNSKRSPVGCFVPVPQRSLLASTTLSYAGQP